MWENANAASHNKELDLTHSGADLLLHEIKIMMKMIWGPIFLVNCSFSACTELAWRQLLLLEINS